MEWLMFPKSEFHSCISLSMRVFVLSEISAGEPQNSVQGCSLTMDKNLAS